MTTEVGGEKPVILVVDDMQINIEVLRGALKKQYQLRTATSGALALQKALEDPKPELILLDVTMPDMDGYEVCRRLKADPATCDIPVIFVTARIKTEDEVQGLALGAVDYLGKPIIPAIVRARVGTQIALRAARRELEQKNLILSEEKELLEEIVTRMHDASPFDSRHVRHLLRPLERTSGDIVLSARRPDGGQHVLAGDFSGHGLTAAFGGPLVSWVFYRMTADGRELRDILREINCILYRQLPSRLYMAASALSVPPDRGSVQVWNHGLPPVLCLAEGVGIRRVDSSGLPFGMRAGTDEFEPHASFDAQSAARIYQYTDGVTEAAAPDGGRFGQLRTEKLISRIFSENLPLDALWEELDAYCSGRGLSDDAVMVETSFA